MAGVMIMGTRAGFVCGEQIVLIVDDGRRQVSWSITQLCCKLVDYSDGQLIL